MVYLNAAKKQIGMFYHIIVQTWDYNPKNKKTIRAFFPNVDESTANRKPLFGTVQLEIKRFYHIFVYMTAKIYNKPAETFTEGENIFIDSLVSTMGASDLIQDIQFLLTA